MKNKWLVGLTIGGAVFLIVPFVLMGIKPTKVAGLILVSHYQTLLLAVLTLAIAMIGFNTYLGLEERISKQVDDLSQQIKKDNIERLRLLLDLERAAQSPETFESVVTKISQNSNLFTFFQDDIHRIFDGFTTPGEVTVTTGIQLLQLLQTLPQLKTDHSWRFFVALTAGVDGWQIARSEVPFLSEHDKDRVIQNLPWLFDQWSENKPDDWKRHLSNLVQALDERFHLSEDVLMEVKRLCDSYYHGIAVTHWQDELGFAGQMTWYLRKTDSALDQWLVSYGDLFTPASIPAEDIMIDGVRKTVKALVRDDIQQQEQNGAPILSKLREARDHLRTVVIFPQELMQSHYQDGWRPYAIVYVKADPLRRVISVPHHTLHDLMTWLDKEHHTTVIAVKDSTNRDPFPFEGRSVDNSVFNQIRPDD